MDEEDQAAASTTSQPVSLYYSISRKGEDFPRQKFGLLDNSDCDGLFLGNSRLTGTVT